MYGIFSYIWAILGVHVGQHSSTMEHLGLDMIGLDCIRIDQTDGWLGGWLGGSECVCACGGAC